MTVASIAVSESPSVAASARSSVDADAVHDVDYIVVGAGSSGCAVAAKLSENPSVRVLLLEAGPQDWYPWIHVPVGYFKTMHHPQYDWCYQTESDPGLNGRQISWPRGKVLGGSSSINGLLYVRGQAEDYDRWRQLGCTGWGWNDVLPYFKDVEDFHGGEDELRGKGGALSVQKHRMKSEICAAWIDAAVQAGYPSNEDYNGASQEGVGYYQLTCRNGWRCSAAAAFLRPAKSRSNLRVQTHAHVSQVVLQGKRAVGVRYVGRDGQTRTVHASREVILSSGALHSPQLLMLSGIGDPAELGKHGIPVVVARPDVGKKMQDHLQARVTFRTRIPTLNDQVRTLMGRARIALEYGLFRTGPMTMAASLAVGFMKTNSAVATPDIQFHVQPWTADSPGEGTHRFSAFTASVCQLRPESRGYLSLASHDPRDKVLVHPGYLTEQVDCDTIVAGVRVAQKIAQTEPLASKILGPMQPGAEVHSDDEILDWVRNTAQTIYHPTGTCRMGNDDEAVVDANLCVRGIDGLRVADCSIMPELVSGNTNAPAIMIGAKLAAMIKEGASPA